MSSMNSQHILQSPSIAAYDSQHNITSQTQSQNLIHMNDIAGASRILSDETMQENKQRKSITEVLHEIISSRSAKDT